MSENNVLDFDDLVPAEAKVKYRGRQYVLREASEGAAVRWRNAQLSQAKYDDSGRFASVGDAADSEPLLVALCLYYADEAGALRVQANGDPDPRHLVQLEIIRSWPSRIVKKMYDWVMTASGLRVEDEAATESAKAGGGAEANGKPSADPTPA